MSDEAEGVDEVVIETRGLSKAYGRRLAVDGLDLRVRRGEIYGFLGPNGAGKSTTIRLLLGLVRPTAGDCFLFGHSVRQDRLRPLRRVGALVEEPVFYGHLSGRKNLELFAALSGGAQPSRIDEVLDQVDLRERQHDRVRAYSHGMRQRLGIAQALLPNPDLLILDEPSSGLDPRGMREVRELVRRLGSQEGMTVFLSSHLLHEVEQVCTHVGLIREGELVASGAVRELLHADSRAATALVHDASLAARVLEEQGRVTVTAVEDGRVRFAAEAGRFAELNALLVGHGVRVSALIPETTTLEDFYLEVLGEEGEA
ncbi:MAG: ABC transporter ATP-binding protein [Armatimonadota bacterium]